MTGQRAGIRELGFHLEPDQLADDSIESEAEEAQYSDSETESPRSTASHTSASDSGDEEEFAARTSHGISAIVLQPFGGKIKRTRRRAVFVQSPCSARRRRRQQAMERARLDHSPSRLREQGLARQMSEPTISLRAVSLKQEKDTAVASGPRRPPNMGPTLSDGPTTSGQSVRLDYFNRRGIASGSTTCSDIESKEAMPAHLAEELRSGMMMRVGEQTMVANLKLLAQRQELRYSPSLQRSPMHGEPHGQSWQLEEADRRERTGDVAARFQKLYSDTIGILSSNMTFTPPLQRHHSMSGIVDMINYCVA